MNDNPMTELMKEMAVSSMAAKIARVHYMDLIAQGFEPEQAMMLVNSLYDSIIKSLPDVLEKLPAFVQRLPAALDTLRYMSSTNS